MTFATYADVADRSLTTGYFMARHPVDIILTLLRARLGQEVEPLTQADKSRLMDVIQTAGQHGVGPALFGGLEALMAQGKADGWQSVAPMLKILEEQNAVRNRKVRDLSLRINTILHEADITPVFLKGCSFIVEDPDAAPWRFVSDVDVLVAPEQAQQAFEVMRSAGFSTSADPASHNDRFHHHLPALVDDATGFAVELHTRLLQERDADLLEPRTIMSGASVLSLPESGEACVLALADRALHAILHSQHSNRAYRMRLVELKSLLDYATLADRDTFDETPLLLASRTSEFADHLIGFMLLSNRLMGTTGLAAGHVSQRAVNWCGQTVQEISHPPSRLVQSGRLASSYLASAIRNPGRITMVLAKLKDQGFRAELQRSARKKSRD